MVGLFGEIVCDLSPRSMNRSLVAAGLALAAAIATALATDSRERRPGPERDKLLVIVIDG